MFRNRRQSNYGHYGYSGQMMHGAPMYDYWYQLPVDRNQPNPYLPLHQNYQWNTFQQQSPFYPQQPFENLGPQNTLFANQPYQQKDSQFLFSNPLQPHEEMVPNSYMPMNGMAMMNPYPQNNMMLKQPGGMHSFLNSFKSQDGSVDFNKMMNTAGQMMNAVSQVSTLVKGFGGMFKV